MYCSKEELGPGLATNGGGKAVIFYKGADNLGIK